MDSAVKHGIIDKRGAWYNMGEEKIGQGKENVVKFLEDNPEVAAQVEAKVRAIVFPGQVIKEKEAPKADKKKAAAEEAPAEGLF